MNLERIAYAARSSGGKITAARARELGLVGTLKAALPAIEAEVKRQKALIAHRATNKTTEWQSPFAARAAALTEFRQKYRNARPASKLPDHDQKSTAVAYRVGPYLVTLIRTVDYDYDRYSKGWHRQHGPATRVRSRISVEWVDARKRVQKLERGTDHHRNGLKSVCTFLAAYRDKLPDVPAPTTDKLSLRLHPIVELAEVDSGRARVTLYERRLLGDLLGYVATYRGQNYHGGDAVSTVEGVVEKAVKARQVRLGKFAASAFGLEAGIEKSLQSLGFCSPGIADAFETLGMAPDELTAETVGKITATKLEQVAVKWRTELATVARIVTSNPKLRAFIPADCAAYLESLT